MSNPWVSALVLAIAALLLAWAVREARRWAMRPVYEAVDAMAHGDYLRAARRFRDFAEGGPFLRRERLSARLHVGNALHLAGEYQAVVREMDALDLATWPAPLTGLVHRIKASALVALGRLGQSEQEARLALQHGHRTSSPEDVAGAELVLGAAALQRGHLTSAAQHVRPFVSSCTLENIGGFIVMADVHRARGEFDEAETWAEAIVDLADSLADAPKFTSGLGRMARIGALWTLATIAADREDWEKAEAHLRGLQLLQPLPPKAAALANGLLGVVYSATQQEGSPTEYFDLAERICAAVPDDRRTLAAVIAMRGRGALCRRDYDEALTQLRRSLDTDAAEVAHPKIWHNIGLAHEGLGDADAARDAFERAARAGQPDNLHVRLARERLEGCDW